MLAMTLCFVSVVVLMLTKVLLRSNTVRTRGVSCQPILERLSDRIAPAIYIWNGPANGLWNPGGQIKHWQNTDGNAVALNLADPDIELRFTDSHKTNSINNIENMVVARLQMTSGYEKSLTLQEHLTVTDGVMESGTITEAKNLIISCSFTIRDGIIEGTGQLKVASPAILHIDASINDKEVNLNRALVVEGIPNLFAQGTVYLSGGDLLLGAGGSIDNSGLIRAIGSEEVRVKSTAGAGTVSFENHGTLAVTMSSDAQSLDFRVPFTNRNRVEVQKGSLWLSAVSNNYATIHLGDGVASSIIHYSLPESQSPSVAHYWRTGTSITGSGEVKLYSTFDANARKDAILTIPNGVTVSLPPSVRFMNNGGAISGGQTPGGGTLKLNGQNTNHLLAGTGLISGVTLEAIATRVYISKHQDSSGQGYAPSVDAGAKLIADRSTVALLGSNFTLWVGTNAEINLKGQGWNAPALPPAHLILLGDGSDILPFSGTTGGLITSQDGAIIIRAVYDSV